MPNIDPWNLRQLAAAIDLPGIPSRGPLTDEIGTKIVDAARAYAELMKAREAQSRTRADEGAA